MKRTLRNHPAGPDRWMVSYADFVTLLFAFFVVMYAVAESSHAKARDLSESVQRALGNGSPPAAAHLVPDQGGVAAVKPATAGQKPEDPAAKAVAELAPSYAYLKQQLRQEIAEGKMQLTLDARGIVVALREKAFFPSGGDGIYPSAFASMGKVAAVIRNLPNAVRLEGHTDSVPIHNERFRSNWDLSAARSIAVLSLFESRYGIPSRRFAVAGYAENDPVAGNDSDEGRAQNRRVDLVIVGGSAAAVPGRNR
jgi:chemotaxis protein MotB